MVRQMELSGLGGPERLVAREREVPGPGTGEVRVRVEASGVAFAEVQMLRGRYPMQPRFPFVPGYDLVGRITAVGPEVAGLAPGDRVAAMPRTGAWADEVVLPASEVVPVPAGVDSGDAVALVTNGVTAWQLAHRSAPVGPGQTVLVHGATGGVGGLLAQLCRQAGATVVGTASEANQEALRAEGVVPVDYRSPDLTERLRRHAPHGYHAVFDHLGPRSVARSRALLAPGGRVVSYGSAATLRDEGGPLRPYLRMLGGLLWWNTLGEPRLTRRRRVSLYYVRPGRRFREDLGTVLGLLAAGTLTPVVHSRHPMSRAADALRILSRGGVHGKIVLVADQERGT
ncbi:medium chain dehydrogenase/reductase family protein [Actinoalloteichus caeruleus]|uniref:medium chain dehydrogenase/reductase family protein n=1 Tax=Actinoalloteichus cyanogriseus TaxID=2893586 RepID=UPI0004AAC2DF|nr:medium chain dehydrogenase/reductase family protein [Actinoalloteichus caeruleus]